MPWKPSAIDAAVKAATHSTPTTVDRTLASRWPALRESLARILLSDPDVSFYYFKMSANRLNAECARIAENLSEQIELLEELLPKVNSSQSAARPRYTAVTAALTESQNGNLSPATLQQVQKEAESLLKYDSATLTNGRRLSRSSSEVMVELESKEEDLYLAWDTLTALVDNAGRVQWDVTTAKSLAMVQPLSGLERAESIQDPGQRFLATAASIAAVTTLTATPSLSQSKELQLTAVQKQLSQLQLPSVASLRRRPNFDFSAPNLLQHATFLVSVSQYVGTLDQNAVRAFRRLGGSTPSSSAQIPTILAQLTESVSRSSRESAVGMLNTFKSNGFGLAEQWCSQFRLREVLTTSEGRKLIPQEAIAEIANRVAYALAPDQYRGR
jgi:hypothetical protein